MTSVRQPPRKRRVRRIRMRIRSVVDGTLVWGSIPVNRLTREQRAALIAAGRLPAR